jgi:preprotein translocase subunit SecG
MINLVIGLHVFVCVFLILVVLLQRGKGADMGAVFGGSTNTILGASGAVSLLQKVTTASAIIFMATSLFLAWNSAKKTTIMDKAGAIPEVNVGVDKQKQEAAPTTGTNAVKPNENKPAESNQKAVKSGEPVQTETKGATTEIPKKKKIKIEDPKPENAVPAEQPKQQ